MAGVYDDAIPVTRRTMVLFFVVDVSGSMGGEKIGAVNDAIADAAPLIGKLSSGNADAEIKVAVLKFADEAEWVTPQPIPAEQFSWTDLVPIGGTRFANVCTALRDKLSQNEFMKEAAGSYAPAIFLLSDGQPLDEYQKELSVLKNNNWFKHAIKVAVAIGNDADKDMLANFTGSTETVIEVHSAADLMYWIKFVSVTASKIGSQSSNVTAEGSGSPISSKQEDFTAAFVAAQSERAQQQAGGVESADSW